MVSSVRILRVLSCSALRYVARQWYILGANEATTESMEILAPALPTIIRVMFCLRFLLVFVLCLMNLHAVVAWPTHDWPLGRAGSASPGQGNHQDRAITNHTSKTKGQHGIETSSYAVAVFREVTTFKHFKHGYTVIGGQSQLMGLLGCRPGAVRHTASVRPKHIQSDGFESKLVFSLAGLLLEPYRSGRVHASPWLPAFFQANPKGSCSYLWLFPKKMGALLW